MKKKLFLMAVGFCGLIQAEEQDFQNLVQRLQTLREKRVESKLSVESAPSAAQSEKEKLTSLSAGSEKIGLEKTDMAFNPRALTLERAIEYAVQNNLGFKIDYSGIETASRKLKRARAGLFDPTLNLSYGRSEEDDSTPRDNAKVGIAKQLSDSGHVSLSYNTSDNNLDRVNSGASVSYRRTLFGKDNAFLSSMTGIENLGLDQQNAFYGYLNAYQALVLRVVEAYLNVVKNYRQIEVSESVLNYRKELLGLTKVKYDLGVVTRLDVLRVEVQVAQQEETIITTKNLYENSLDQLLDLLDYEQHIGAVYLEYEPELDFQVYNPEKYEQLAKLNRLDLKVERNNLLKEEANLKLQEQTLHNKVQLAGSYGRSNTDISWSKTHDYDLNSWSLGLEYSLPFGNRVNREDLMIQKVSLQNQKYRITDKEDSISLEVRTAIRSIEATRKSLKVLEKNLEQAKENLKLAQLSYEKGIKSSIEVLDAQDDLLSVNKRYVDVILDLKIAEYRLARDCGLIGIPEHIESAVRLWGYQK